MISFICGEFNAEISEQCIESFLYMDELSNLVEEKTCFKNRSCIVLCGPIMFTLFNELTRHIGLSDHHKLVLSILKAAVLRGQPTEITYRGDYKQFHSSKI